MKIVVVGSGAGGAMMARHLSSKGHEVLVLEAGQPFKPLSRKVIHAEHLRLMLGKERTITRMFPFMRTERSGDTVIVRGIGSGGCTTLSCGNFMPTERGLKDIGLDLTSEFQEVGSTVRRCTIPREIWRPTTQRMFDIAKEMGLRPEPSMKAIDLGKCRGCGMCELGCNTRARWDARTWMDDAVSFGTKVSFGSEVREVTVENGKVSGVVVHTSQGDSNIKADQVVLAAGGIGTAQILIRSKVPVSDTLWIDPVITIGGTLRDSSQLNEVPMAWYCRSGDHMISPYLDLLSHFFCPEWRNVGSKDRIGVMVKLADTANGKVDVDGKVTKVFTEKDTKALSEATAKVKGLMTDAGVQGPFVQGLINGGHLGGTLPLRTKDISGMRPEALPEGLWVADLSLAPCSQGSPTMMLAAALALRVGKTMIGDI
jgi:choline dehydrogenase-like flavoprotein